MKIFTTLFSILFFGAGLAHAESLICVVKVNGEEGLRKQVSIAENASVTLADIEGFRFKLNNHGDSRFEIEVFDAGAETRSYAEGILKSANDAVKWSFWSREILLESSCALSSNS